MPLILTALCISVTVSKCLSVGVCFHNITIWYISAKEPDRPAVRVSAAEDAKKVWDILKMTLGSESMNTGLTKAELHLRQLGC